VKARPAKSDLIRQTVRGQVEPFTLADIVVQLPSASSQLIKKVLAEMKKAGQVRLVGRGRVRVGRRSDDTSVRSSEHDTGFKGSVDHPTPAVSRVLCKRLSVG